MSTLERERTSPLVWAGIGVAVAAAIGWLLIRPCCVPTETAAVIIVADGSSPALEGLAAAIHDGPEPLLASDRVGLAEADITMIIATYDLAGDLEQRGSFHLSGDGQDRVRKAADARRQAVALQETLDQLPPATPGNALRALPNMLETGGSYDRSVIVVVGLGRALVDDFDVDQTDLSTPEQRQHVLQQLQGAGYVPALQTGQQLLLLAPSEGVDNGIIAGHVHAFAEELCSAIGAGCDVVRTLP